MIFDIIILLTIVFCCIGIYIINLTPKKIPKQFQKKKRLLNSTSFILLIILSTIWYGSFIEPKRLIVSHTDIQLQSEKNFEIAKIVLITDLHVGHLKKENFIKKLVDQLKNIETKVILLGGDFLSGNPQAAEYLKPFRELTPEKKIYAVWGNHDFHVGAYSDEVRDDTKYTRIIFEKTGITLLENEKVLVENKPEDFWILGIDSVLARRDNFSQTYYGISPEDQRTKIVLVHNPDLMFEVTKYYTPIDIVVTGHTHGGQIRLPLIGAVPKIPIYIGQKYDKGLFDYKGYKLFISGGVGETGTRARLFNPPEISVLSIWK